MSLYSNYIQERTNKRIIETDKGYATYINYEDGIFIEDIYVLPEFRKTGEASKLADKITDIAKQNGYKQIFGAVCPSANGSTDSLKVLLAYGFKLKSSIENYIYFYKEIN